VDDADHQSQTVTGARKSCSPAWVTFLDQKWSFFVIAEVPHLL
jgi:hypothetical protein